jgi:uncharacterized protein YjbI with pentapeptide repeats
MWQVMDRGTYKGSSFKGAVLQNSVLSGSDFTGADLTDTVPYTYLSQLHYTIFY